MKVLILGVGNLLRSDDGFGPTVVKELKDEITDPEIEILDIGTSLSLVLWPYLWDEDLSEKIIIDVIVDGKTGLNKYDISVIPPSFFLQSTHFFLSRELLENLIKKRCENHNI
ncbi:MAG: hydrogenase maturation protease [Nitrososphaeria archaeon]